MPLFGLEQEVATSDDYYTPAWLFDKMAIDFDLDVASPPGGVPWIPAKRSLSIADDGLTAPWTGCVWMNPPFSKPTPWVDRFIEHRHGVVLFGFTRGRWCDRLWSSDAAWIRLPYNFKFESRHGPISSGALHVCLAAFGAECVEAISRVGRVR